MESIGLELHRLVAPVSFLFFFFFNSFLRRVRLGRIGLASYWEEGWLDL